LRSDGEAEDGRVGGITLLYTGGIGRSVGRKDSRRDRGLHFLLGRVERERQRELQRDHEAPPELEEVICAGPASGRTGAERA